jgi:hypothetical protein
LQNSKAQKIVQFATQFMRALCLKMSKYSEEADIEINKTDLAKEQIEDAIDLFLSGKRISAITLAGAADGIFTGLLKQQGISSAAEETWQEVEEIRQSTGLAYAGDRTKEDAYNEWNQFRNRLKHHDNRDGEVIQFSAFDEAYHAIQRANADAEKLGIFPKNRQEFENWLIENIYM